MIVVAEGNDDADRVLQLASTQPMLAACIGVHPDRAASDDIAAMCRKIETVADELVGIGEVGLDYWLAKEEDDRRVQREVLAQFVALSISHDLPLNVHSRSAGHYTIELLRDLGAQRVLMHAFDGRAHYALGGVEAGFSFSIPPSIVRSPQKQKLVRRLPLTHLLLETDSPVLGPEKGERNEPANARRSAECIAQVKGIGLDEVIEVTTANARRLFSRLG